MTTALKQPPAADPGVAAGSLRNRLLYWLIGSLMLLLGINAIGIYRNAADAANAAYDRTLLASARMVAENLRVIDGALTLAIPYAAIDLLESDVKGRFFFRVLAPGDVFVAGWSDLPPVRNEVALSPNYATLVRFYEDQYQGVPVRVAVLLQPIAENGFNGVATIQFAEDYQSRRGLIRSILTEAMLGQGLMVAAAMVLVIVAIHIAFRPLQNFSKELTARASDDLRPFDPGSVQTEVRPLIESLNAYMHRLRELIELRKRFLGNAAHQLRTPLSVLKTQAGFAANCERPAELREVVGAMETTVDQAARLAHQLLTLTRAEHGFVVTEPQSVDLLALARDSSLDWYDRARERGIELGFQEITDRAATLRGDPLLLRELLHNLIDNAVRYCRPGDTITVRVVAAGQQSPPRLEVEDSGPGIDESERGKVTERFYRVPGQREPGSGLGLAIVSEIALQHRGRVELSTSRGGGLLVAVLFGAQNAVDIPADRRAQPD